MASVVFDFKELAEFGQNCLNVAQKTMPKETRKFLNQEGFKLRKIARGNAKAKVKKDTGAYHKSIRKGKVYKYKGDKDALAVRVYSGLRYAHVIENGRRYTKDGKEYFKEGKHVLEGSAKEFEGEYVGDIDGFIDDVITKGL